MKNTALMFTGLDLKFLDLFDKNIVVFQLRIFYFRSLTIIRETLNNSRDFIIYLWRTLSKAFL